MDSASLPRARLVLWAALIPLVYAPLYLVGRHPVGWWWLPLLSTAIAASAVALLLRTDLLDRAAVRLALLAVPNLYWAGVHDFRDANFLPALLITAYWALEHRRHVLLVIASIAALGVREEAGLVIVMMGVYALLRSHGWRMGLGLMALGAVWTAIVIPMMSSLFWTPGLWIDPRGFFQDVLGQWGSTP